MLPTWWLPLGLFHHRECYSGEFSSFRSAEADSVQRDLRREDFDLILQHRNVVIDRYLVDQFYQVMEENALYLDLVARELHENTGLSHQEMIAHIAHNPDNLFTLSISRFKRQPLEWREVIYK